MMADKPKTAEQIIAQIGKAEIIPDDKTVGGYYHNVICPACKSQIERDVAKRIFERIDQNIKTTAEIYGSNGNDREFTFRESWYQQLKKEIEES
jgi:hypothetical protein